MSSSALSFSFSLAQHDSNDLALLPLVSEARATHQGIAGWKLIETMGGSLKKNVLHEFELGRAIETDQGVKSQIAFAVVAGCAAAVHPLRSLTAGACRADRIPG
jgi:hypothetical protein